MKRLSCAALAALPFAWLATPAQAAYMGWALGEIWSPGSAVLEDFNTYTPGTTIAALAIGDGTLGPDVNIGTESAPGIHFLGVAGTGSYVYVTADTSVTLTLGSDMKYLGFLWGTVDAFNTLAFYDGETLIGSVITGADVLPPGDGETAVYANFYAHEGTFNRVVFGSVGQNSFEFDNVRVAPTPLPAALGLFGLAVAGFGAFGMRRRASAAA